MDSSTLRTAAASTRLFTINSSPCFSSSPRRLITTSLAFKRINNNSYKNDDDNNNNHHPLTLRTKDLSSVSYRNHPTPTSETEEKMLDSRSWEILKIKLKQLGLDIGRCAPGVENRMLCPKCNGGDSEELSLSLFLDEDGFSAVWMCFRAKCGWKGSTSALVDNNRSQSSLKKFSKMKTIREITEDSLELEPLGNELRAYFAERLISAETLRRNRVMQKRHGHEVVIAFPYWRNGKLVNCKYRDFNKKFWQVSVLSVFTYLLIP